MQRKTMIDGQRLEFIKRYLIKEGIHDESLLADLVDHLCCTIEHEMENGVCFERAFSISVNLLSAEKVGKIEDDFKYLLTIKTKTMFRKMAYSFGYLSLMLAVSAILFIPYLESLGSKRSQAIDDLAELAGISLESYPDIAHLDVLAGQSHQSFSNSVLIIACVIFLLTVVPFWFYRGYQRSMMKLKAY